MSKRWYVVHAYGFEKAVMRALKERIELSGLQDQFGEVLVPAEEVVEMRAGQKRAGAQVLPGLRARGDGAERRHLAR